MLWCLLKLKSEHRLKKRLLKQNSKRKELFLKLALLLPIGLTFFLFTSTVSAGQLQPLTETKTLGLFIRQEGNYSGDGIEITTHTDGNKLNWINHQRHPNSIKQIPLEFGVGKRWPPFLTLSSEKKVKFEVRIEDKRAEGTIPEKSTIGFYFQDPPPKSWAGKKTKLMVKIENKKKEIELTWSGEREWFLHEKRVEDICFLVEPHRDRIETLWNLLTKNGINHASGENIFGYQRIRTQEEIFKEGRATCLDLAIWMAGALEEPDIFLSKDHAWIRTSQEEIDPTWALISKTNTPVPWQERGKRKITETPWKQINIKSWKRWYFSNQ